MKRCILVAMSLLCACGAFAQRAQKKEFMPANDATWGHLEFSVINQDGKAVNDGPFSFTAFADSPDNEYRSLYKNLKVTGSLSKGYLHGPLSLSFVCDIQRRGGYTDIRDIKYTGNFVEGVANGNFNLNYIWNGKVERKMNVTFKNGNLVGKYYAFLDNAFDITGTFTSNGKMTGVWNFAEWKNDKTLGRVLINESRTFVNGVATVLPGYDDDLKAYAQKYATNKMTAAQLLEKGIVVKSAEHDLNDKVSSIVRTQYILYWDKLGRFSFYGNSNLEYQYLEYLPIKSEKEVAEFIKQISTWDDCYELSHFVGFDKEVNLYYSYKNGQIGQYFSAQHTEQILDVVNKIGKQNTERALAELKKAFKTFFDTYCNQSPEDIKSKWRGSNWCEFYADLSALNVIAPYSACKIENVELCGEGDLKPAYFKVFVLFSCPENNESSNNLIGTYGTKLNRLTVYVDDNMQILVSPTFKSGNVKRVDLGWGQVNEYGKALNQLAVNNEFAKAALLGYDKLLSAANHKQRAGEMDKLNVDYFKAEYTSVLNYNTALNYLLAEFDKLKSTHASSIDVVSAIDDNIKNLDLNWKPEAGCTIAEIEKYDWRGKFNAYLAPLSEKADKFVQKRSAIYQQNHEMAALKAGSVILNAYNAYFKNVDLNAAADLSAVKLDEVLTIQDKCKTLLTSADIVSINKAVKKAKLTDIDDILDYCAKNFTQEGVNESEVQKVVVIEAKIVKEEKVRETKPRKNGSGYGQYADLSGLWHFQDNGSGIGVNVNYIGGYRFNPNIFLGLGTGVNVNDENGNYTVSYDENATTFDVAYFPHSFLSLPIYLHFRADFGKAQNAWRPYVSVSAGYHMSLAPIGSALPGQFWDGWNYVTSDSPMYREITNQKNQGLMADINFGINRKLTEKLGMYLGVGFKAESRKEQLSISRNSNSGGGASGNGNATVCAARLSLGFSF